MSSRGYLDGDGDGTPDSPMVVPSDESAGDGENSSPPRNNNRESPQGGDRNEDEQDAPNAGADEQGTAATDTQPAASASRPRLLAVRTLPAPPPTTNPTVAQAVPILPTPAPSDNQTAALVSNSSAPAPADIPGFDFSTVTAGLPVHMKSVGNIVPPGVNQALKCNHETLVPHVTDPTKITAKFRVEVPGRTDDYYEQTDIIPMRDESVVSSADPEYYFIPNLTARKLKKKFRASKKNAGAPNLWVRQGTSYTWVRKDPEGGPDHVFNLTIMFRRFNSTTHKYEEMYLNLKMLINPDPNATKWMYAYNKWIDQIRRRRDAMYIKTDHKDHWSVAERRALCEAINAYIRTSGLVRFGSGATVQIPQADMQDMADAVNKVGDHARKADAVRGQIFSSHVKKNKAIFDLVNLAKDIRDRVASGEILPRDMRYPMEAIPRHAFPKDLKPLKKRGAGDKNPTARKRLADPMDDGRLDHSDAPADVPLPGYIQDFLNGDLTASIRPSKKVKFATDSGDELPIDEQWAETDEEVLSEGDERARDGDTLESVSCEYVSEEEASDDDEDAEEGQHLNHLQAAIHNSYHRRAVPASVGIEIPGEEDRDDSDSDSEDDEPASVAAPLGRTAKGGQRAQAAAQPATPSPPQKRERSRDGEDDTSEGDDESNIGTPQGRSIKKARSKASE